MSFQRAELCANENSSRILQNIELLTVIPISEINEGIRIIQSLTEHQEELNSFSTYFTRTWIMRFDLTLWSFSSTDNFEIFGITNNGPENNN
ncbi:hypothetical protein HZS_4474 [Henneguya salminicola]|nr:hypothetical protein HZS_4474 [Henneguya salminicola]